MYLVAGLLAALPAMAAEGSATGKLSLGGPDKPVELALKHAYYVRGADASDAAKGAARIIFSGADLGAAIEACKDAHCTTTISEDGMTLEIGDTAALHYWAHVTPMQIAGDLPRTALVLDTDTPTRVAGTLKIAGNGVTTTIKFDAPLLKSFDAP
jgi:hypothetical protein